MKIIDLSEEEACNENNILFINQLCSNLGLDYATYSTTDRVSGSVQGYANYPEEWKSHYINRGLHLVDPTIHKSALSIAPVDWSRFERDAKYDAVFSAACDFGLPNQGITVPVRGVFGDRGLLSVTTNCSDMEWEKQKTKIMGDLQQAAVHMQDAVMRSDVFARSLSLPNLSAREIEVLQWVAAGKTYQDIGDILSISDRTVEVHLRSSRDKLGALTTVQAVGRAIGMKLIYPL
ncbi:MAG: autoinducer binding domain-containing protein [Rhodobacteraceae bacterium]|nr:autoinducer binding domain-containing protein [Paracoccaceae bacterium]